MQNFSFIFALLFTLTLSAQEIATVTVTDDVVTVTVDTTTTVYNINKVVYSRYRNAVAMRNDPQIAGIEPPKVVAPTVYYCDGGEFVITLKGDELIIDKSRLQDGQWLPVSIELYILE
jgi:hypothetical protein